MHFALLHQQVVALLARFGNSHVLPMKIQSKKIAKVAKEIWTNNALGEG